MALAIGGSSAPAKPPRGSLWVDVRDYGAKADGGATDNSGPFQAAVDDLATKLRGNFNSSGVVYIPSAPKPYFLNKSVWVDADNIEVRGDGWGSRVSMNGGNRHSVFLFGIRRVEQQYSNGSWVPVQIDPSYRPDLFGKLDASAVPATGVRWGLRTHANSFVQFQAGPISCGVSSAASWAYLDLWGETSQLTVEFCVEPPDGQPFATNSPLCGIGTIPTDLAPFAFMIWDDPNKVMAIFRTSDMEPGRGNDAFRLFSFSLAGATPPYRIAAQFDLDSAVCAAFVNGTQVTLNDLRNMAPDAPVPFAPGSGLKFATNDHHPFMIGASGVNGPYGYPSGVDLRVYGLRLSNTVRYQNKGAGQRQTRVDSPSTPVNDAYAYFGKDARTVCFLKGTDDPSTAGRVVTVQNGDTAVLDGQTSGLFLHTVSPSGTSNNAIREIHVEASTPYGQAISLGTVLQMTIENVRAVNGFNAVGSFNMTANYFVYIRNCWLDAYGDPYYGAIQLSHGRDIHFASSGRVAMRHLGCDAAWENVVVTFSAPVAECIFKARNYCYGGNFSVTNILVDFEGPTLSKAVFYCEAHCGVPSTSLTLKEVFLGSVGAQTPVVMLKDGLQEFELVHKCWLSVENVQAYAADYSALVDLDGPLWYGEVKAVANTNTRLNHRQKWGTAANVVVRDTHFIAPPRSLSWYSGAHVLEVRSPADGQFTDWRCATSGTYGTPAPPAWVGLNSLSLTPHGLAAYVLDHGYLTVALS